MIEFHPTVIKLKAQKKSNPKSYLNYDSICQSPSDPLCKLQLKTYGPVSLSLTSIILFQFVRVFGFDY